MESMREIVDREMVRALVARDVTCQKTGRVLDTRTCLVVRDCDGDPVLVLDPSCTGDDELMTRIRSAGWTVDTPE